MFVCNLPPYILFLSVSCYSFRILCGEHTMLLADHVPGSTCLHKSFSCMVWSFYAYFYYHPLSPFFPFGIRLLFGLSLNVYLFCRGMFSYFMRNIWLHFYLSLYPSFSFQIDSVNLFTYAVLRLTPLALSHGASSWSNSRKADTACNTSAGALLLNSSSAVDQYYNSSDASPLVRHNYPLVRPLQHSKWSKGKDGFLTTDIWGTDVNSLVPTCPTIWLHQTEEKMYILAYQHRGLTVILLIPVSSVSGEQGIATVKQQILENVSFSFLPILKKKKKVIWLLADHGLLHWVIGIVNQLFVTILWSKLYFY